MDVVRLILLIAHFVGLAAIVGGYIIQLPHKGPINFASMLTGSIVQIVSGVGLIAARKLEGLDVIDVKMAVKLGIALLVLVAVLVGRRVSSTGAKQRPWFHIAGVLAIANIAVAVLWS
jgi:hypothetical protein